MSASNLIAFSVTSLIIELTPGPNMAYLAMLAAAKGRISALAAVAGVAIGLSGLGAAVGFGAGLWLQSSAIFQSLRWVGAAYLCWLAYESWRDGGRPTDTAASEDTMGRSFRRGLMTNLLNPKAALFFVAVMPQFADERRWGSSYLTLTLVYVAIATAVHAMIVMAAGALNPILIHPARKAIAGDVFAGILVVSAGWLLFETAR